MEDLEKYIKERLEQIEDNYIYLIEKLDITHNPIDKETLINKIRDLRIEKITLEDVLEKIEGEE